MNPSHQRFVEIADRLINAIERLRSEIDGSNSWMRDPCATALENIRDLKNLALSDMLPASEGAGLGISRGLGEWAPDRISEIGTELERHFIENC